MNNNGGHLKGEKTCLVLSKGIVWITRLPSAYPQVLNTFGFPVIITIVLPHNHLYCGSVQGKNLAQICHTVSSYDQNPLVNQSCTADQLPVKSLIVFASSCSTILLQGPCLAVCLGHLGLCTLGGAAVDGSQPRPVSLFWPLCVKGWMLPTHCQRGWEVRPLSTGQQEKQDRRNWNCTEVKSTFWAVGLLLFKVVALMEQNIKHLKATEPCEMWLPERRSAKTSSLSTQFAHNIEWYLVCIHLNTKH